MAEYSLQLKTEDVGTEKKRTLTLTDVNPEASSQILKQFTKKINDLTMNTYVQTDYIVRTNLDTETPPVDERKTPTFEYEESRVEISKINAGNVDSNIKTNSDGQPYLYVLHDNVLAGVVPSSQSGVKAIGRMKLYDESKPITGPVTYVAGVAGTDTYKPVEQTFVTTK